MTSVQQTSDGGYIMCGRSESNKSGEKTENSKGLDDYWVVKTDANGSKQWDKTIGTSTEDIYISSIQQTSDGGYILGSASYSDKSGDKTENSRGGEDYWIIKTDANGNKQWDKTIGGEDNDRCYSVKEISCNHYFAFGSSDSRISGDKTVDNCAEDLENNDYWMVKFSYKGFNNVQITESEKENKTVIPNISGKNLLVYPNPAKNVVQVQTKGTAVISLIDGAERLLLMQTINGNGTINVSKLQPGMYYIKNNTTGETKKMLIAR